MGQGGGWVGGQRVQGVCHVFRRLGPTASLVQQLRSFARPPSNPAPAEQLTSGGRVRHSHIGVAGSGCVLHGLLHHVLHRLLLHGLLLLLHRGLLHGRLLHGRLLHRRLLHDGGRKAAAHGNLLQRRSRLLRAHLRGRHGRGGLRRRRRCVLLGRRLGGGARRGRRGGSGGASCHSRVGGGSGGGLAHSHHLGCLLTCATAGLEVLGLHIQRLAAAAAPGGLGRLPNRQRRAARLPHSSDHAAAAAASAGAAGGAAAGGTAVGCAAGSLVLKAGGREVGILNHKLLGRAAAWQGKSGEGAGVRLGCGEQAWATYPPPPTTTTTTTDCRATSR